MVLSRLVTALRLELRFIMGHWAYWLVVLAYCAFMVMLTNVPDITGETLMARGLGTTSAGLGSLMLIFLAGLSASRARRTRFDVLEDTFPTASEVYLGRVLAVIVSGLILLVAPVGLALWVGPLDGVLRGLPLYLTSTIIAFAFSATLAWRIALHANSRSALLLLILLWLLSVVTPAFINVYFGPFPGIRAVNFSRAGASMYSDVWGWLREGHLPLLLNLMYAGQTMALLGFGVWRDHARRFYVQSPAALAVMAAGLVIGLGACAAFNSEMAVQVDAVRSDWRVADAHKDEKLLPAAAPYRVVRYDITLDAETTRFVTELEVTNTGDTTLHTFDLTLSHLLHVSDSSVTFTREDDWLHITPETPIDPGDTLTMRLGYSGDFSRYFPVIYLPPSLWDFVRPDTLQLTPRGGWYPLAGRVLLTYDFFWGQGPRDVFAGACEATSEDFLLPEAVPFAVRVENFAHSISSNLVQTAENAFSGTTSAVFMIGTERVTTQTVDWLSLTAVERDTAAYHNDALRTFRADFDHLRQFFPELNHLHVIVLDDATSNPAMMLRAPGFFLSGGAMPRTDDRLIVTAYKYLLSDGPGTYEESALPLVHSLFWMHSPQTVYQLTAFLWLHRKAEGDGEQIRIWLTEGYPRQDANGSSTIFIAGRGETPALALAEFYSAHGAAETEALLHRLRSASPSDLITWIREASADVE